MRKADAAKPGGPPHDASRSNDIVAAPRTLACVLLSVVFCLAPACARAQQWTTDLEAGFLHNSNIGDATAGSDVHAVTGLTQAVSTGPFFELSPGTNLTLNAQARETEFSSYASQDSLAAGAGLRLDTKFGLGRQAPHLFLAASETRLLFHDDIRNGWLQTWTGGGRAPFGDRLWLRGELGIDRRRGSAGDSVRAGLPADVFDQFARRITVASDFTLREDLLLQLETTFRRGEAEYIETTNLADTFEGATAVARDPAYGPSVFIEKVQVRALILDARLSWALSEHASLTLGFRRQLTVDITATLYTRSVPALTYVYRFD
jgi:hypothetical protein